MPRPRPRFDDDEYVPHPRRRPDTDDGEPPERLGAADTTLRPRPAPGSVVTDPGATDTDLGVLKTGKEADVHLLERAAPGRPGCLLAAKRYRAPEHRMFHRDAGYL